MAEKVNATGNVASDVKRAGKKAAFNPLMDNLMRLGYGVRGLVYVVMGILAFQLIFGQNGSAPSPQGAIAAIAKQPSSSWFLWLILIGLVAYSLWGVIRAVFDPLHKGSDTKGVVNRVGFLISAISYAYLAYVTYSIMSGNGSAASGGSSSPAAMSSIMGKSWGRILIGLVGVGILGDGLYMIYQGLNNTFDKQFKAYAMTPDQVHAAVQLGRLGTAARGIVFVFIGALLLDAAYKSNGSQPVGFGAALSAMMQQPYGPWLVAIIAVGLVAFGIYSMMCGVWFRTRRPQ